MRASGDLGLWTEAAMDRREWLRRTLGGVAGAQALGTIALAGQDAGPAGKGTADTSESELEAATKSLTKARIGPINTIRSAHYQAIGDAPEGFMKLMLGDCEQLALDFDKHFRSSGFKVHPADRRLTLVVFRDNRSFSRFFPQLTS